MQQEESGNKKEKRNENLKLCIKCDNVHMKSPNIPQADGDFVGVGPAEVEVVRLSVPTLLGGWGPCCKLGGDVGAAFDNQ